MCHNVTASRTQREHKGVHVCLPGRLRLQGADAELDLTSTEESGWEERERDPQSRRGALVQQRGSGLGLKGGHVIIASVPVSQLRRKHPWRRPLHHTLLWETLLWGPHRGPSVTASSLLWDFEPRISSFQPGPLISLKAEKLHTPCRWS